MEDVYNIEDWKRDHGNEQPGEFFLLDDSKLQGDLFDQGGQRGQDVCRLLRSRIEYAVSLFEQAAELKSEAKAALKGLEDELGFPKEVVRAAKEIADASGTSGIGTLRERLERDYHNAVRASNLAARLGYKAPEKEHAELEAKATAAQKAARAWGIDAPKPELPGVVATAGEEDKPALGTAIAGAAREYDRKQGVADVVDKVVDHVHSIVDKALGLKSGDDIRMGILLAVRKGYGKVETCQAVAQLVGRTKGFAAKNWSELEGAGILHRVDGQWQVNEELAGQLAEAG